MEDSLSTDGEPGGGFWDGFKAVYVLSLLSRRRSSGNNVSDGEQL